MNDKQKIQEIKRVFKAFHRPDSRLDSIDVCIRIERIIDE